MLANLAQHPQHNLPEYRPAFLEAKENVNRSFPKLDRLKPAIRRRYESYLRRRKEQEARREAALRARQTPQDRFITQEEADEDQIVRQIHAQEHSDLAVQLAQDEFSRRAASHAAGGNEEVGTGREAGDDLSSRMQQLHSQINRPQRAVDGQTMHEHSHAAISSQFNYPPVHSPQRSSSPSQRIQRDNLSPPSIPAKISVPPILPVKQAGFASTEAPARPDKLPTAQTGSQQSPSKSTFIFKPSAFLEDGTPLRTLFLPPTLRTTFLRIAHKNTLANLETCAFLAGSLIANALFVSKLIVPAQTATSDTCEMINESQLFDYVDSQPDLMVVGWIHTHPRQTCFMSSRDLHTHSGYQMMLAESIAIVCAPSYGDTSHGGSWGAFRLTDPPGKKTVLTCQQPGLFHPHDVENIYTDALRPGHVVEANGLEFEVVDLRDKL